MPANVRIWETLSFPSNFTYFVGVKWSLTFDIPKRPIINGFEKVILMGSCFAEHQKESFARCGISVQSNPFGILYNPVSIARVIERIYADQWYEAADFIKYDGQWFSLEHHGSMQFASTQEAVSTCNEILKDFKLGIERAQAFVLTFGTSIVHCLRDNGEIVGNCHKMPNSLFTQRQLSLEETLGSINRILSKVSDLNPDCAIVTSVSPIRHVRSGIMENNLSKSTLRVAIAESALASTYFPGYEIFIDELRDYRFAKEDLAHPNEQAIDYIWHRFKETYFTEEMINKTEKILKLRRLQDHIPRQDALKHEAQIAALKEKLLQEIPDATL